jgi:hypothetical protein
MSMTISAQPGMYLLIPVEMYAALLTDSTAAPRGARIEESAVAQAPPPKPKRTRKVHATQPIEIKINGRRLILRIAGESEGFILPPSVDDRVAFGNVRRAAHDWARAQGATEGQIAAISKDLNNAGYYVVGPRQGRKPARKAAALAALADL